jgi:hypothetical protein
MCISESWDARFCQNYSQALVLVCSQCNTQNVTNAKFRKECGSRLVVGSQQDIDTRLSSLQQSAPKGLQDKLVAARSQVRGERRPVTILFTDIVGSTAIASKLDPEEWREIVAGKRG